MSIGWQDDAGDRRSVSIVDGSRSTGLQHAHHRIVLSSNKRNRATRVRDGHDGVNGEDVSGHGERLAEEEAHQHESYIAQVSSVYLFRR